MTETLSLEPHILVVDDNPSIHEDIRKILTPFAPAAGELDVIESQLFGDARARPEGTPFRIESAYQGAEAVEMAARARAAGDPYALAFVDMRMPPGIDGLETIVRLWGQDRRLQVVVCSAFSDHGWADIAATPGAGDALLVLRKPFEGIEIRQMAHAMCAKWALERQLDERQAQLEDAVTERTMALIAANDQLRAQALDASRLEAALERARSLETVGQLASTLAHERGAPLASVMQQVRVLRLAFHALTRLHERYRRVVLKASTGPEMSRLVHELHEAEQAIDLMALLFEVPRIFDRLCDGAERVRHVAAAVQEVVREQTGEHGVTAALNAATAPPAPPSSDRRR